jgi:class 3 adenylate cyclase
MSESRKLVAILATDVVGFSRLAGADEDRTLARLRTLRSDLIDPTVAVHHGRVVKRTGDGVLVEFRSVVEAVRCAIEIQSGMVERNAGVPAERRIEFRAGIHLGDVVEESDGDLMGDGVNIAARLEGIAKPGTICLSEDAYRQVRARLDLAVCDLGQTQLKNITELVHVYSLEVGVPAGRQKSSQPLILGSALVAVIILIAGGVFYTRPFARTSPAAPPPVSQTVVQTPPPVSAPPQQIATQTPALPQLPQAATQTPAPPQLPQAATQTPAPPQLPQSATQTPARPQLPQSATQTLPPEPPLASPPSADEAAWQNAAAAATRASFSEYLKQFSTGLHVQEAQLRIADLIINAPATAKKFDGAWQTTWTCPNLGQYPGYSFRFTGQVKDGAYHGLKGIKGEPSSMVLDGKIESDGTAAFFGEIIVGSSLVGLGAARGTPSDYHALAQFERIGGTGKRIEGRPCSLTFEKH